MTPQIPRFPLGLILLGGATFYLLNFYRFLISLTYFCGLSLHLLYLSSPPPNEVVEVVEVANVIGLMVFLQ